MDKGFCQKHNCEFVLTEGCPHCLAEKRGERFKPSPLSIVKVQYFSETTGELSAREYTYYSRAALQVGDVVTVPVRDTTAKAKVSAIDVPEAEIAAFKDKVKVILPSSNGSLAEAARDAGAQVTEVSISGGIPKGMEIPKSTTTTTEPAEDGVLVQKPGGDIEVKNYYEQALGLKTHAEKRVIKTVADLKLATDDLSLISKIMKALTDKKKEYLKPLKEQVAAITENYKFWMEPIEAANTITRQKMTDYDAEQRLIRQKQEEINRKRMEAAQEEAALNNGEITESVNLVEVTPEVKRTSTDMGTASMVDSWKWRVIDFAAVPDAYKVIDSSQLTAIAKKHHDQKQVPGVRFYNEPTVRMSTK